MSEDMRPLILTACLDETSQAFFNEKRKTFFPPERNFLDAHLTLFHALPAQEFSTIDNVLNTIASQHSVLHGRADDIFFMGFGSAYHIDCPALNDMHKTLSNLWHDWLTRQDSQTFKPHVTFQNKVDPNLAKKTFHECRALFEPFDVQIRGLDLWHYDNGPWTHISKYNFNAYTV